MKTIGLTHDKRGSGGAWTVARWYTEWMRRNGGDDWRTMFLDEDTATPEFLKMLRAGSVPENAVPRLLPLFHFPPFLGGRYLARKAMQDAEQVHVIGGVALHGYMAPPQIPQILWVGTTIGDERRPNLPVLDLPRRILHSVTLPSLERIEAEVIRSARRVFSQSPKTASSLLRRGVSGSRLELLPVPIDTARFRPRGHRRSGMLFVGRARDPRKGFTTLLELMSKSDLLRETGVDVVSEFPPIVPKALRPYVRWRGRVDAVEEVFSRAEAFVLTSRQEGLGIVVFEALASSTPVVALASGGPDEWIRVSGGGFVVRDGAEFIRRVEGLLGDPALRDSMGSAGRKWVQANMSADDFLRDPTIFSL